MVIFGAGIAGLAAVVVIPVATGLFGAVYAVPAFTATAALCLLTYRLDRVQSPAAAWTLFKSSGPCLAVILAAAVADQLA